METRAQEILQIGPHTFIAYGQIPQSHYEMLYTSYSPFALLDVKAEL